MQGIRVMKNKDSKKTKLKWDKLDNTALLFPVIANESMSSVYRISLTLSEEIEKDLLQEALNRVLPYCGIYIQGYVSSSITVGGSFGFVSK